MASPTGFEDRARAVRYLGVVAAGVAAVLYFLIGLGVLPVGESSSGGTPDLFGFGAILGGAFAVAAVLLWRFQSRVLWAAVAILQIVVIVGYVALADLRVPPFEPWGLVVKACQVLVLCAVTFLMFSGRRRAAFGHVSQGRTA